MVFKPREQCGMQVLCCIMMRNRFENYGQRKVKRWTVCDKQSSVYKESNVAK